MNYSRTLIHNLTYGSMHRLVSVPNVSRDHPGLFGHGIWVHLGYRASKCTSSRRYRDKTFSTARTTRRSCTDSPRNYHNVGDASMLGCQRIKEKI